MKTKPNKTKAQGVGLIETPETHPLLIHFLSPLERFAYATGLKPLFTGWMRCPLKLPA